MSSNLSKMLYDQLLVSLEEIEAVISPSEAQGALCGIISTSRVIDLDAWLSFALDQSGTEPEAIAGTELERVLGELREETEISFGTESGGVTLLLPDDDEPLNDRLLALASWCEGFLFGVGLSFPTLASGTDKLPESAQEFIIDIREISRLDPESGDDDAELHYMELVEYIRVGALIFHEEIHTLSNAIMPKPTSTTKH